MIQWQMLDTRTRFGFEQGHVASYTKHVLCRHALITLVATTRIFLHEPESPKLTVRLNQLSFPIRTGFGKFKATNVSNLDDGSRFRQQKRERAKVFLLQLKPSCLSNKVQNRTASGAWRANPAQYQQGWALLNHMV